MVSYCNMYTHNIKHNAHIIHYCRQAWIKEDEDEALNTMQHALVFKRENVNEYIKFINHFGPALTGVAAWNNNKTTGKKGPSELLTVTDEAFILTFASSTIVQPGRLRKNGNQEKMWKFP